VTTPTPFTIQLGLLGATRVEVAGKDITQLVQSLEVGAAQGEVTVLSLRLTAGATIEGQGVVEVVANRPPGDAVRSLPLEVIETQAKQVARLSGSYTAAVLDAAAGLLDEMTAEAAR
jgi:hypothetical protein